MADLTAEALRSLVCYDPRSGQFTRLLRANWCAAGGWLDRNGHVRISIAGRAYAAHRIAWLYVHGRWPQGDIDHINGDRADNRIENLRDVCKAMNQQNQRKAHRTNATGLLGVTFNTARSKYQAQIGVSGRNKYLGLFDTATEAHQAYLAAKRALHEGNTL